MAHSINQYKADLRELNFILFEQFGLGELVGKAPFEDWGPEEVKLVLGEVYRFATEVSGPLNSPGDTEGCRLVDGEVKAPKGFKEAWEQLYESGFKSLSVEEEYGGQGAPSAVACVAGELGAGPNTAFDMYPGLTVGAADLIAAFGTPEQKETYCEKMFGGAKHLSSA